jgi:hypothetical protein
MRPRGLLPVLAVIITIAPVARAAGPVATPDRSVEPVILTGQQFPSWSAGPDVTLREPQLADDSGTHKQSSCYKPGSNPYDP